MTGRPPSGTSRLALVLVTLALTAPPAALAATCPRTTLGDVENEVMCPVCGTPLSLATEAPQAQRERALIQRLVDDCRTKAEIKDRLAAEFGDEVLSLPGGDGFDLAAYVVPALIVLLGGGAVTAAALQWHRARGGPSAAGPGSGQPPSDEAADRLQSDLDRYDL